MGVTEEHTGDDVRRVALNDASQRLGAVGQRVGAVPAREHVSDDPDALPCVLGALQLVNEKGEHAAEVRVRGLEQGKVVVFIVQVRVEGDDAQAERVADRVGGVVRPGRGGRRLVDPAVVLPQRGDVVVVPGQLVAEGPVVVDAVRHVEVVWVGVVVLISFVISMQ